jgi:hypothetical protein
MYALIRSGDLVAVQPDQEGNSGPLPECAAAGQPVGRGRQLIALDEHRLCTTTPAFLKYLGLRDRLTCPRYLRSRPARIWLTPGRVDHCRGGPRISLDSLRCPATSRRVFPGCRSETDTIETCLLVLAGSGCLRAYDGAT